MTGDRRVVDAASTRQFRPAARVSTVQSRELSVARSLTQQDLAATRVVRVIGAQNVLVVRR